MTVEEVKKHFEAQGIKEGDALYCAANSKDSGEAKVKNWKYDQFNEKKSTGSVSTKEDIDCILNGYPDKTVIWLYFGAFDKFATPVKNEE